MSSSNKSKKALAQEYIEPDEQQHIDSLVEQLSAKMDRDYAKQRFLRDAHPKMHGCVRAELIVEPNLDAKLRIGIFREPGSFPAWVRFSNQSGDVSPDFTKDIRGVAIKLLDVTGEKLLPDTSAENTQDFILISDDRFVTKDIAEFDALVKALIAGKLAMGWFFFNPFNSHLRVMRNLLGSLRRHGNPLEIRYFSVSPYLLGKNAVKYSLKPQLSTTTPIPAKPSDSYLREAMTQTLRTNDVAFDFMVQFQLDPDTMPIEDPGVRWDEKASPFIKVATLKIPAQDFNTPQQREFGDNLSFNPWHCLAEHRPLGGINRARRQIYQRLSDHRHKQNSDPARQSVKNEIP